MMIDLDTPIIPGESAAGIRLGQSLSELLSQVTPTSVEQMERTTRYEFGPVWVWVINNSIDQIGLFQGYRGTLPEDIGIGSRMISIKERIGNIFEDIEDNLCVSNSPGWCFETNQWQNGDEPDENLNASIVEIFVFAKSKK